MTAAPPIGSLARLIKGTKLEKTHPEPRVEEFRRECLALLLRSIESNDMGDASTRKDEGDTGTPTPTSASIVSASPSEISGIDEPAEILKAISAYKARWKKIGVVIDDNDVNSFVGGWTARAEAFPPEPVMVDLEVGAKAIEKIDVNYPTTNKKQAKACAEAWGLKWE